MDVVLIVGVVLTVLAFLSVCARLYTRYFIARQLWYDDLTAVAALLATIAATVTQSINAVPTASDGFGGADRSSYLFFFWLNDVVYNAAMLFIKMTFLLQYFRVFRQVHTMWVAYIIAMILVGCWCLSQTLLVVFACLPIQGFWAEVPDAKCWITPSFVYINATGTIVTDLVVLFLPLPTLWNLKLRRSQKWGLIGIFGIGGIVPIISLLRLRTINSTDLEGIVEAGCWSLAELCTGVITASLATIRLLVSRAVPSLRVELGAHELSSKSRRTTSGRQSSTGSQRDLFEEAESEVPSRTLSNDADATTDSDRPVPGETMSTRSIINTADSQTNSLHFGLPRHLRTGVKTRVTTGPSRGQSMSAGGADFLGTFGIRVERDWVVSESAAPE